jgi:MoxR-like ATPase
MSAVLDREELTSDDVFGAVVQEKFSKVRQACRDGMIERDGEVDCVLTALIANEHVLLVGDPGLGKSMLADAVVAAIDGAKFEILCNKYTTPEEVIGPVSIQAMRRDEYRRVTAHKLPEAHIAFLDEIFKSSSAILNVLLKLLNERRFVNGPDVIDCPLQMCIAASNEWGDGEGGKELAALFDRFLFRRQVQRIMDPRNVDRLLWDSHLEIKVPCMLSPAEIDKARHDATALPWSDAAKDAFKQVLNALRAEAISPGDRRLRKSVKATQAFAYLAGASEVLPDHLEILADVLWDDPATQMKEAAKIIGKVANPSGLIVNQLLSEAQQILNKVNVKDMAEATSATKKLGELVKKAESLDGAKSVGTKANQAMVHLKQQLVQLKTRMVEAI